MRSHTQLLYPFLFKSFLSSLKGRQVEGLSPDIRGFWDVTCFSATPLLISREAEAAKDYFLEMAGTFSQVHTWMCSVLFIIWSEPWALRARQVLYHEVLYFKIEVFILEWGGGLTDIE